MDLVKARKIGLLLGFFLGSVTFAYAHAASLSEYEIKAAFLYNFAKFVEWPTDAVKPSDEFVVGILGEDPFQRSIEMELDGVTIQDKKLLFKPIASAQEAASCQVVFISASEEERLTAILDELKGMPVLTVSDMKKFVQRGGMVGFVREHNKVGFDINRSVAEGAGLKISSQLLKLAKTIVRSLIPRSMA